MNPAETSLELARRHVSEGEQRIAEQTQRIVELSLDGHDTTTAEELLVVLEQTVRVMRKRLAEEERVHSVPDEPPGSFPQE